MDTWIVGTLDTKTATRLVDDSALSAYFDMAVLHCAAFLATDTGKVDSMDIRPIIAESTLPSE